MAANTYRLPNQRAGSSGASAGFADLLASASKTDTGMSLQPVNGSDPRVAAVPDFRNMTPAGFKAQAQAMYDRGEIDLTTLGVMQLAGNTGDDDVVAGGGTLDFTARIRSLMDFETRSGHRASALSPYRVYENILSKITSRVGANLVG